MVATLQKTVKQAVLDAGVLQSGHFIFADGDHADIKLEMDNLWNSPENLAIVLDLLTDAKGLPPTDVILGVPRGGQMITQEIVASKRLDLPIALLVRVPGGKKQDFRFVTKQDEELAKSAKSVRIYEDVVTTLSSIAGVVKLLDPKKQDIHSLTIWRRGEVKPEYRMGITDHYLVEEVLSQYSQSECTNKDCKNEY